MQLTHEELAGTVRHIVAQALRDARQFDPFPTLDLAVIAFPQQGTPAWANVLVTREWREGIVAQIDSRAGPVGNIQYFADVTDAQGRSIAWAPGADWTHLQGLRPLGGPGPFQSIAPYPASLIKLMVAVGVCVVIDQGQAQWAQPLVHEGRSLSVEQWFDDMITISSNEATTALVALLHGCGLIRRSGGEELHNGLHQAFERHGLYALRLSNTRRNGGWLNRDGAGVGHLQMTAWDTARLLWLMGEHAPAELPRPPWLEPSVQPIVQKSSARVFWRCMAEQALHEVLSSTLVSGVAGWRRGIPAALPERWIEPDGSANPAGVRRPPDIRPEQARAEVLFAHKTGTTENYLSDAGLVMALQPGGRRYIIALLSTLGSRHAPSDQTVADWCIASIGAAVDSWLARRMA